MIMVGMGGVGLLLQINIKKKELNSSRALTMM